MLCVWYGLAPSNGQRNHLELRTATKPGYYPVTTFVLMLMPTADSSKHLTKTGDVVLFVVVKEQENMDMRGIAPVSQEHV